MKFNLYVIIPSINQLVRRMICNFEETEIMRKKQDRVDRNK